MAITYCANTECRWSTERRGGVFHFRDGKWYCEDCVHFRFELNPGKNLYEFETFNLGKSPSEQPVQVKSLSHLRQLEKEHGVISVAANYDSKHFDHRPEAPSQRPAYVERAMRAAAELRSEGRS